ncbi:2-haloacid dehalogenase [Mucilaginibacter yixingensis]|uniref:2-haloacid dehalogenase n=1 Tax=Mucilaginibacter yixingensis TaxID=1295612 RepID=A0A2T5J8I5_9SPHI|nr:HAD family phosphatase [Mucilaginibacter yixingensis]PTQ95771.1 2-haloacid dehalogenase [Mucilaginibacter yixingensis]
MTTPVKAFIFDLGMVLIDWNPYHLYRQLFDNDADIHTFLTTICTMDWNEEQDMGRPIKEGTELLVAQYPEHEANIRAYYGRWDEMLGGPIAGTVEIFNSLKASGQYKLYALSNWSAETFGIAQERYGFLNEFDGVVISGVEKTRKPFPDFYQILLNRYQLQPAECLFIDDNLRNVLAARELGIDSIHFVGAENLAEELGNRNITL